MVINKMLAKMVNNLVVVNVKEFMLLELFIKIVNYIY